MNAGPAEPAAPVDPARASVATGTTAMSEETRDAALAAVRGMRRWAIALTVLVTGALCVLIVSGLLFLQTSGLAREEVDYAFEEFYGDPEFTYVVSDTERAAHVQQISELIQSSFGEDPESVDVRPVTITYEETADDTDQAYAVTYVPSGSAIPVSGLVTGVADVKFAGLVPLPGDYTGHLGQADFGTLLAEYGRHTTAPMGFSYAYTSSLTERSWDVDDTLEVRGVEYPVTDLWCVNEGWVPEAGVTSLDVDAGPAPTVHLFVRDAEAGTFTYLGSELSLVPVFPWGW